MVRTLWPMALAGAVLILIGCGPKEPAEKKLVIGFSQVGAESAWRTAETTSMKDEAAARGVTLKFSDGQNKQDNQIKALRAFIAQGVDLIILAPVVETGWDPVLQEAKKAKIPVILLDRSIVTSDPGLYVTHIGPDCVEEGRMAARWLVEKLNEKGNVLELQGTPGSAPAIARKQGFEEVVKEHPEVTIVMSQSGDFRRSNGKQVTEALLKKAQGEQISLDAIYAHNDDMAIGAIQAVEDAGLKPGEDIIIVSIDGVKAAFEAMAAEKLNCTVECNPLLGPTAFDVVEKIMKGEAVPKWTKMSTRWFEQPVTDELLNSRHY